jgi:hypothetical protein
MAVAELPRVRPAAAPMALKPSAVLVKGCDGYPSGTTGTVTGERQGCLVFVPDESAAVARWATPRRSLLVPPSFVAAI